jgi:hypothetical protein
VAAHPARRHHRAHLGRGGHRCSRQVLVDLGGSTGPESGDEAGNGSGGPIDPVTGLRDYYDPDDGLTGEDGQKVAWHDLLTRWPLVEADMHAEYGVDLGEPGLLKGRSWRWLRTRLFGLLLADTRIARALTPDDDKQERRGKSWR